MTVDGKHISDADRIRLMIELETETAYEAFCPVSTGETAAAQTINQIVSATPAALDDDESWPAVRFQELAALMAGLDEVEVMS